VVVGAVGEVVGAKIGCLKGQMGGERVGAVGEGVGAKNVCLKGQISFKILR
jgi:hypothetical protein